MALGRMAQKGRIFFPGNPWPAGHALKEAKWSAQLGPEGLRFHFHFKSRDYYAEEEREDEGIDDDWKGIGGWYNYHACTLSSTFWGHPGLLVAKPGKPLDLEKLEGKTLRADKVSGKQLPSDFDTEGLALGIYLLGHDTACDHRIRFVKRRGPGSYDVDWRGRIALTYIGDTKLAHSFRLDLPKLTFDGIDVADELDSKTAKELLPKVLVGSSRYQLKRRRFVRAKR